MERRVLITNPVSGGGKGLEISKIIEKQLKAYGIDYKVFYTEKKHEATLLAKEMPLPNDIVYSIGGDGTLNEVVTGIVNSDKKLCIIPAGSGNDFYKTISENKGLSKIDVGYANDKYFINSFSIGLDSDICGNANLFRKSYIPSSMIYKLSILYTLFGYKAKEMTIDEEVKKATILSITNGKYYGGGFKISPDAVIDDGFLDMTLVDEKSKMEIIYMLGKLIKATHQECNGVTSSKIKNLTITSNTELLACLDGEMITSSEFKIGIIPKAINLYQDEVIDVKKLIKK